jgi:hypothetical protein
MNEIGSHALFYLAEAVDSAINRAEGDFKRPILKDVRSDAAEYFSEQHKQVGVAIAQLKAIRNELKGQIWSALKSEGLVNDAAGPLAMLCTKPNGPKNKASGETVRR